MAPPKTHKPTPGRFKPAVAQLKTGADAVRRTSPAAPSVYRPQPTPLVLQRKVRSEPDVNQPTRKPVAPPVYRPHARHGALQAKTAAARNPSLHHTTSPKVAHSKSGIQLKPNSRVIQRAELPPDEEKKVNPRFCVMLKVSLNGHEIGAYVSKTSKYGAASEHDHAEDGIVHAIQHVVGLLERTGGALIDDMTEAEKAIAKALVFKAKNKLRIYNLTASPCTSSTAKKKTSNKGEGEGCTEQLIDLQTAGLDLQIDDQIIPVQFDITVEAHHLYQPGANGLEKELSKEASAHACKRMVAKGIIVKIAT